MVFSSPKDKGLYSSKSEDNHILSVTKLEEEKISERKYFLRNNLLVSLCVTFSIR